MTPSKTCPPKCQEQQKRDDLESKYKDACQRHATRHQYKYAFQARQAVREIFERGKA